MEGSGGTLGERSRIKRGVVETNSLEYDSVRGEKELAQCNGITVHSHGPNVPWIWLT